MPIMAKTSRAIEAQPVNDSYGSLAGTNDVEMVRVIPPRSGLRARIAGFQYLPGATAHTITVMPALAAAVVASEAAAAQAVLSVTNIPTSPFNSGLLAAADWLCVMDENGSWGGYKIASISGNDITVVVSVGEAGASGFSEKIPKDGTVYFHFASGDHPNRQFLTVASTLFTINGENSAGGSALGDNEPILIHSPNTTNAGNLKWVNFVYVGGV